MRLIDADGLVEWLTKPTGFQTNCEDCPSSGSECVKCIVEEVIKNAPTVDPVKHEFEWTYVKDKLPECDWGAETAPVLFIFGSTVFSGYYGRGGKLRDSYFRQYNDVHEGVDSKDVIAWAWASSLNPPKKE